MANACKHVVLFTLIVSLALIACSPVETETPAEPHTPEAIIEKLRISYVNRDLSSYLDCFESDFVFYTAPGWPYPNPDTCWYLDEESTLTADLFDNAFMIELELEATETNPWHDDPTALGMTCPFVLKVYLDQISGYRATGEAVFRFVEYDTDKWRIDLWADYSQILGSRESTTWTFIKTAF